jgi:hypothetical protein
MASTSSFYTRVSRFKFINASTMIVDAQQHGLPGDGPQLAVFGSGRYRSSDVYLAVKPVAKLEEAGDFLFTQADSANRNGVEARTARFHCSARVVSASYRFVGIRCWAPGYVSTTRTGQQIDHPLGE